MTDPQENLTRGIGLYSLKENGYKINFSPNVKLEVTRTRSRRRGGDPRRVPHAGRGRQHPGGDQRGDAQRRRLDHLGAGARHQAARGLCDLGLRLREHHRHPGLRALPRLAAARRRRRGGGHDGRLLGLADAPHPARLPGRDRVLLPLQGPPPRDAAPGRGDRARLRPDPAGHGRLAGRGGPVGGELRRHDHLPAVLRKGAHPIPAQGRGLSRIEGQARHLPLRRREQGADRRHRGLRHARGRSGLLRAHDQAADRNLLRPLVPLGQADDHGRPDPVAAVAGDRHGRRPQCLPRPLLQGRGARAAHHPVGGGHDPAQRGLRPAGAGGRARREGRPVCRSRPAACGP